MTGLVLLLGVMTLVASDMTVKVAPTVGLRVDSFEWTEGEPGVWESALEWNSLMIVQAGLELEALLEDDEGTGFIFGGGGENRLDNFIV